jgi:hypothetical protein
LCDVVRIVDNFSISHDIYYHGWFPDKLDGLRNRLK